MRLNPDCIRDILFFVEENSGYSKEADFRLTTPNNVIEKYGYEEVFYHINQCEMSGLVYGVRKTMNPSYHVKDLTPLGHKFLADIRSDTNWNKTKEIAKKAGSFSLDALTNIAVKVVGEAIKHQF